MGRRPRAALGMLLHWIEENYPDSILIEPIADDAIDKMVVPDDCLDLLQEIRGGVKCAAQDRRQRVLTCGNLCDGAFAWKAELDCTKATDSGGYVAAGKLLIL